MLREYEAERDPQKTVNLLKAVQWTRAAWESSVATTTIRRCWIKSTLIGERAEELEESREERELDGDTIVVDDGTADRLQLQAQIAQLPIENLTSLDEFLTPEDETIVDEDSDIFAAVVERYSTDTLGAEEESDEEEIEEVTDADALISIERLKLWKLQKGNGDDIKALDRVEREIICHKSSVGNQTTILRFFKPI